MEGEVRLAMTEESIHALGMRLNNSARGLSLDLIAKSSELMPYRLLTREG